MHTAARLLVSVFSIIFQSLAKLHNETLVSKKYVFLTGMFTWVTEQRTSFTMTIQSFLFQFIGGKTTASILEEVLAILIELVKAMEKVTLFYSQ